MIRRFPTNRRCESRSIHVGPSQQDPGSKESQKIHSGWNDSSRAVRRIRHFENQVRGLHLSIWPIKTLPACINALIHARLTASMPVVIAVALMISSTQVQALDFVKGGGAGAIEVKPNETVILTREQVQSELTSHDHWEGTFRCETQTTDGGLVVCGFMLPVPGKLKKLLQEQPLRMATCIDPDHCIQTVVTLIDNTKRRTRNDETEIPPAARTRAIRKDQSSVEVKEPMIPRVTKTTSTETTLQQPKVSPPLSRPSARRTDNGGIVVGRHEYLPPFRYPHHPSSVAAVLRKLPVTDWPNYAYLNTDQRQPNHAEAQWTLELAVAHRTALERDLYSPHPVIAAPGGNNGELAINAFEQVLQCYTEMLQEHQAALASEPKSAASQQVIVVAKHGIASVYQHMGDVYSLQAVEVLDQSGDVTRPGPKKGRANKKFQQLTLKYLEQAEEAFRDLLTEKGFRKSDGETDNMSAFDFQNDGSAYVVSRTEAEIGWAHCLQRLGVAVLDPMAQDPDLQAAMQLYQNHLQDPNAEFTDIFSFPDEVKQQYKHLLEQADRSQGYFLSATKVFERIIQTIPENDVHRGPERIEYLRHLGTSYQSLGSAATMIGDTDKAVEYNELALSVYQKAYPSMSDRFDVADDLVSAIAELLFGLASAHLSLGRYANAKTRYREAMDWYDQQKLPAPDQGFAPMYGDNPDEVLLLIQQYEDVLQEYLSILEDPQLTSVRSGEDESMYSQDDPVFIKDQAYEADLYSALGALYQERGDATQAYSHLTQAIQLYKLSGDVLDHHMGSAQYNLAMMYLKQGEFSMSADFYEQALDVFQVSVGEGRNPLTYNPAMGIDDDVAGSTSRTKTSATAKSDPQKKRVQEASEPKAATTTGASTGNKKVTLGLYQDLSRILLNDTTTTDNDEL
jgi:tetratricopeptide (TPR) repeat protein